LKIVSAALPPSQFFAGWFTTRPEAVAAVQNDRLVNVCDGTSLEPVLLGQDVEQLGIGVRVLLARIRSAPCSNVGAIRRRSLTRPG
jgi:hypothetical protein